MTDELILYHDFASPFSRLALALARDAADRAGLALSLVPFELRPAPAPLPEPADEEFAAELEAALPLAAEWGIPLGRPPRVPRTLKAHEAVEHARSTGRDIDLAEALYKALWTDGRDLSRLDTLVAVAATAGVDAHDVHVALGLDTHREAVERAGRDAEAAGITGVPTLIHAGRSVVGLIPPDELRQWLRSG